MLSASAMQAGAPQVAEAVEQFEVAEVGKGGAARVEALLKAFRAQQGARESSSPVKREGLGPRCVTICCRA